MLKERAKDIVIELGKQELLKALANTQSIVERKNIIPILSHILIESTDENLQVSATDMERLFSQRIIAKIDQRFSFTVDAHLFHDIARKLDDKYKVTLSLSNQFMNLRSNDSYFTLPILPSDKFPKLDDSIYASKFSIPSIELQRMLDESKFAMAREEMRYNLNGINLSIAGSIAKMTATDAHRIALSFSNKVSSSTDFSGVIIPQKTVIELRKIISGMEGNVEVALAENKILFKGPNFHFLSKLVDGRFPEYNENPDKNDERISIKVQPAFFAAVDRVATIINEEVSGMVISLNNKILTLSASNAHGGKSEESFAVETDYTGQLETKVNASYFLDIASIMKEDAMVISLSKSPRSAILVKKASADNFKYIIMPLRI